MILQGSQRGGPKALAQHLMNQRDNDHIELHEIRGLAAEDITGALCEIDASKGASRSNKPFYHLSLNPPIAGNATITDFESAIERVEAELGLSGQPRAVVFHEKLGRRHAHVVWSRVDLAKGRMIHMPFDRRRLQAASIALYRQHGWEMPIGFEKGGVALKNNFNDAEWQQSKRTRVSPEDHKRLIGAAYRQSDDLPSFKQALEHQGYYLACGRRAFVAVDIHGEIHAVTRATGERKRAVEDRLGDPTALPTVEQVQQDLRHRRTAQIERDMEALKQAHKQQSAPYRRELQKLRDLQRADRKLFRDWHQQQRIHLETTLAARYRKGLRGFVDRVLGVKRRTDEQNRQEREQAEREARLKKDDMIRKHLEQRRTLHVKVERLTSQQKRELHVLRQDIAALLSFDTGGRLDRAQEHFDQATTRREADRQEQTRRPRRERKPRQRRSRGHGYRMRPEQPGHPPDDEPS